MSRAVEWVRKCVSLEGLRDQAMKKKLGGHLPPVGRTWNELPNGVVGSVIYD